MKVQEAIEQLGLFGIKTSTETLYSNGKDFIGGRVKASALYKGVNDEMGKFPTTSSNSKSQGKVLVNSPLFFPSSVTLYKKFLKEQCGVDHIGN